MIIRRKAKTKKKQIEEGNIKKNLSNKCIDCSCFKNGKDTVHSGWKKCTNGSIIPGNTTACHNFKKNSENNKKRIRRKS